MDAVVLVIASAFAAGDIGAGVSASASLGALVSDTPGIVLEIGSAATCDAYGNMTEVWSDGTTVITVGGCL